MRTVLKIGGSILEPAPSPELAQALVQRYNGGDHTVVVHGGGKALTAMLERLGIETTFSNGLRVTDERTLEAAVMVLAGAVNKKLVAAINEAAARPIAAGFCGIDGGSVQARVTRPELGYVGEVTGGDGRLLLTLLEEGFIPVLASIATGEGGGALNVNADQFASACARLVQADRLVFVTDVAGVLDHAGKRIPALAVEELEWLVSSGTISHGMLPKVTACREALEAGVGEVEIIGIDAALRFGLWEASDCPGTRVLVAAKQESSGLRAGHG